MVDPEVLSIVSDAATNRVRMGAVLKEADVSANTWWHWKTGRRDPRVSALRRVRAALDRRLAEIAP